MRDEAFAFQGRKPSVFGAYQSYDAAKDQALTVLGAPNLLPVSLLCLWLDPMLFDNGALSQLLTTISSSSARVYFSRTASGQVNSTLAAMARAMRGVARQCPGLSEIALVLCDVANGFAETQRSQVIEWSKGASEFLRTEASHALVLANLNRVTELYLFAATKLSEAGFDLTDDKSAIRIEGYVPLAFVVDDSTASRGRTPDPARDTSRPPGTDGTTGEQPSTAKQTPEPGSADPGAEFDLSRLELRYERIADAKTGATSGLQVLLASADNGAPPHAWANRGWSSIHGCGRVDKRVLLLAYAQISAWRRDGFEASLCVPISMESLAQMDVADRWLLAMRSAGVSPRTINFGVTPASGDRGQTVADNVAKLSKAGVTFSLLGFGTGYSSLALLKAFPFSRLEVCEAYVRDLQSEDDGSLIVRSTLAMAKKLGLRTCAAGVSSLDVAKKVAELDADEFRGTWSSKALTGEQVRAEGMLKPSRVASSGVLESLLKRFSGRND